MEYYKQRIDNPDLEVDENCILVLKNCGPKGYPGMAEVSNMEFVFEAAETWDSPTWCAFRTRA